MPEKLAPILVIQDYDMKMIQLMNLKKDRQKQLETIESAQNNLSNKLKTRSAHLADTKKTIRLAEGEIAEINSKMKVLEEKLSNIKKVDEYNAVTHEIANLDRERHLVEQKLSDLYDKVAAEEEQYKALEETIHSNQESSKVLQDEINDSISQINAEGSALKAERDELVSHVDPELFAVYERLLKIKKDRVIVPLENRCCSGCHITLTAQHENLVRKGERIVFCEHCSRINYWQESKLGEDTGATKTRRRRSSAKSS